MKKLLSALISAALIAMPVAVISTPASAQTAAPGNAGEKSADAKAKAKKTKAKAKSKSKAKKSAGKKQK